MARRISLSMGEVYGLLDAIEHRECGLHRLLLLIRARESLGDPHLVERLVLLPRAGERARQCRAAEDITGVERDRPTRGYERGIKLPHLHQRGAETLLRLWIAVVERNGLFKQL